MIKSLKYICMIAIITTAITGCGIKPGAGDLEPPSKDTSPFPQTYPKS